MSTALLIALDHLYIGDGLEIVVIKRSTEQSENDLFQVEKSYHRLPQH